MGAVPGEHPLMQEKPVLEHPNVTMLGYQTKAYSMDGWFGVDLGINFDIGASWEVPLYNRNQNLILRVRPAVFVGGRQYLMVQLWYIKFYVFFDVLPARFTFFDAYAQVDIVNYTDLCYAARWLFDVTRLQLFF